MRCTHCALLLTAAWLLGCNVQTGVSANDQERPPPFARRQPAPTATASSARARASPSIQAEPGPAPSQSALVCCTPELDFPVREPSGDYPGPILRGRLERRFTSHDGEFAACGYSVPTEDAVGGMLLCKGSTVLGAALFLAPIAWEPRGNRLLVGMQAPDDDPDLFVLDVGRGEYEKESHLRSATRIGGRYDEFVAWHGDWICARNGMMEYPRTIHQWLRIPDAKGPVGRPPAIGCPPR